MTGTCTPATPAPSSDFEFEFEFKLLGNLWQFVAIRGNSWQFVANQATFAEAGHWAASSPINTMIDKSEHMLYDSTVHYRLSHYLLYFSQRFVG
jgi:hypothetical protein